MSKGTVFISGAGGYIALHIVDQLLSQQYSVIGSVQTELEGDKIIKNFQNRYNSEEINFQYEVVPDISITDCFDFVFKKHNNIDYVLHTVSPVQFNTGKSIEDAFVNPAIEGTLSILKAVTRYAPQVIKVIHTSSLGAIYTSTVKKLYKESVITEDSWNPISLNLAEVIELKLVGTEMSGLVGYTASKTFAERLAWEYVKDEKNDVKFTFTSVNPPFVIGPQLFTDIIAENRMNASTVFITGLLKSTPKDDELPFLSFTSISADVRDVALTHVMAITRDLSGNRLLPVLGKFSQQRILNIMNDNFPELRGKIAKGKPEMAPLYEDTCFEYDFSRTQKLMSDYKYIPLEKAVIDSTRQILDVKGIDNFDSI